MTNIDTTYLYEGIELDGKALELFYKLEEEQEEAIINMILKQARHAGTVTSNNMIYVYQIEDDGCIYIENIVDGTLFEGIDAE